jgi:hypothetical protein
LRVDATVATDFLVLRGFRRGRVPVFTVVAHAAPGTAARAAASRLRFLARRAIDAMPALAPAGEDIEWALDAFEDAAYLPASLEVVRRLDRLDRMWLGNAVLAAWAV